MRARRRLRRWRICAMSREQVWRAAGWVLAVLGLVLAVSGQWIGLIIGVIGTIKATE